MSAATFAVGSGICVGSLGVSSVGLVLQKRWHVANVARPDCDRIPFYQDCGWVVAFTTYAVGNVAHVPALALIPQTVCAALDSLILVFNAFFAQRMLGEVVTCRDWLGYAVIVLGIGVSVWNAPRGDTQYDGPELVSLLFREQYLVWVAVAASLIALSSAVVFAFRDAEQPPAWTATAASLRPAMLSSFILQLTKVVAGLLGAGALLDWHLWAFLLGLVTVNVWETKWLQEAISRYSSTVVIPAFQVQMTVYAIVGGGLYFREFDDWAGEPVTQPVSFAGGVAIALCAAVYITTFAEGEEVAGEWSVEGPLPPAEVASTEATPLVPSRAHPRFAASVPPQQGPTPPCQPSRPLSFAPGASFQPATSFAFNPAKSFVPTPSFNPNLTFAGVGSPRSQSRALSRAHGLTNLSLNVSFGAPGALYFAQMSTARRHDSPLRHLRTVQSVWEPERNKQAEERGTPLDKTLPNIREATGGTG